MLWVDLEMTGLNNKIDKIIEIAAILTDNQLNIIELGPEIVIKCDEEILDNMDDWCKNAHG